MKNDMVIMAAIAVLVCGASMAAKAADAVKTEKCYGIAKVGKNDCKTSIHSCAGKSTKAADKSDFLMVPAGLCAKIKDSEMTDVTVKATAPAPAPAAAPTATTPPVKK